MIILLIFFKVEAFILKFKQREELLTFNYQPTIIKVPISLIIIFHKI